MPRAAVLLALAALASGCSGVSGTRAVRPSDATTSATSAPTTTLTNPTASTMVKAAATTTTTRSPSTSSAGATVVQVPALRGVASGQAVVVHAGGYGQTSATLTAYEKAGDGWRVVFGPWAARVGSAGLASPGTKREGDLRTPSGTYGFGFMFGVMPDPGVKFPFRRVTGANIVWDDDPASSHYNEWVDTNQQDAGASPEPMYVRPAYDLGAVIAYNTERTPGRGSAIFLHVSTGRGTAGCVSLPPGQLRSLLLWLDPRRSPVIAIGAG